jgi:hypothetical protein
VLREELSDADERFAGFGVWRAFNTEALAAVLDSIGCIPTSYEVRVVCAVSEVASLDRRAAVWVLVRNSTLQKGLQRPLDTNL